MHHHMIKQQQMIFFGKTKCKLPEEKEHPHQYTLYGCHQTNTYNRKDDNSISLLFTYQTKIINTTTPRIKPKMLIQKERNLEHTIFHLMDYNNRLCNDQSSSYRSDCILHTNHTCNPLN